MSDYYEEIRKAQKEIREIQERFQREMKETQREIRISLEQSNIQTRLDYKKSARETLRDLNSMYNGSEIRAEAIYRLKKGYRESALEEHILSDE